MPPAPGYEALVLTVDTAVLGRRERDVRRGLHAAAEDRARHACSTARSTRRWTWAFVRAEPIRFANVVGRATSATAPRRSTLADYINTQFDPGLSWADVDWLRSMWDGPIVIKGIQTVADARDRRRRRASRPSPCRTTAAASSTARPPPIDLVAPVADAVGDRIEIICDGGVRRGSDIVKAVAARRHGVHGRAGLPLRARAPAASAGVDHVLEPARRRRAPHDGAPRRTDHRRPRPPPPGARPTHGVNRPHGR